MICPICQKVELKEPAPEMFQCSACGNGRGIRGFHFVWSITDIFESDGLIVGVVVLYNEIEDFYQLASMSWEVGRDSPITGSPQIDMLEMIEDDEYTDFALPVVWLGKKGQLKDNMYKDTYGRKEKT